MNVLCFIQFGIRSAVLNAELPQNSRLHIIEVSFLHGFYQIICNYKELNKWINEANNLVVAWPLSWVPFSSLDCLLIMYLCFMKALVSKTLPLLFVSNYWLVYASITWIAISFLCSGLVLDPYCWETEKVIDMEGYQLNNIWNFDIESFVRSLHRLLPCADKVAPYKQFKLFCVFLFRHSMRGYLIIW